MCSPSWTNLRWTITIIRFHKTHKQRTTSTSSCLTPSAMNMSGDESIETSIHEASDALNTIFTPITLPCGRAIPNRLVKASLYEHLAAFWGGPPNAYHHGLYAHWAYGGWGMVLTGNVQVKKDHLGLGRDVVVPEDDDEIIKRGFKVLADVIHGKGAEGDTASGNGTLAIMQLSHAGRQSPTFLGGRSIFQPPLAASSVPVQLKQPGTSGLLSRVISGILFRVPREMTHDDIDNTVDAFVRGARLAWRSGFDGVEIHAAHGYLVAGFISPQSNTRKDEYSASTDPLRFLHRIISAIRAPGVVPKDFVLGVKLNAADYVLCANSSEENDEDRVLRHVKDIATWDIVDFIEVSGGTYENPEFMTEIETAKGEPSNKREALFSRFSQRARATLLSSSTSPYTPPLGSSRPRPLILLTGGLNTSQLMTSALRNGHADLLGIGRLSVELPYLPRVLRQTSGITPPSSLSTPVLSERLLELLEALIKELWTRIPDALRPGFPPLIGAGVAMAAYQVTMRRLAVTPVPVGNQITERRIAVKPKLLDVVRLWLYVAPGPGLVRLTDSTWVVVALVIVVGVLVTSMVP